MKKKERVIELLRGNSVDRTPVGFWLHFPKEVISQGINQQVQAHIEFKNETKTDILKIMNENEMRATEKINTVNDWKNIKRLTKTSKLITNQIEILNRIVERNQEDCFLLGTIHGLMASLSHSSGYSYSTSYKIMNQHFNENPEILKEGFKVIYENTLLMLEATMSTGIDGIYYAALGGEADKFSQEFFNSTLKELEIDLLNHVKSINKESVIALHMCKENVDLRRYKEYPSDIVNWAMHESHFNLTEAKDVFSNKVILGGFDDRSGVLVEGSREDIKKELDRIETDFLETPHIIGSDCTLPTAIDRKRIRLVSELLM